MAADAAIFFDKSIKRTCKAIHSLALDLSKIPGWIIRKQYIADRLGVSLRTVNRYFTELVKKELAYYDEVKHRWYVFRKPKPNKTATSIGRGEPNLVEGDEPNLDDINQKDNYPEEKTTTQPPSETIILPDPVAPAVVVFLSEDCEPMPDSAPTVPIEEEAQVALTYPEQLTTKQKADISLLRR
jgi:hypothetical protein